MEKELLGVAEAVLKSAESAAKVDGISVDKSPEVSHCVSLMKKLKDFPVSFDVLTSTQVDKRLRRLRNHNKEKIRLMAKWLLEIWSVIIKNNLSRNQKNGLTISVESTTTRNKRKRNGEGRVKKPTRETKVCKQQEEQQQQTIKCPDASRNKVRESLLEGLRKVSGEVAKEDDEEMKEKVRSRDPVSVALSVESEMFKKLGPFNGTMKFKYRSLLFNVKDPKNHDFRKKILLGEVKPERLVSMTTEEMASKERQSVINQIKEKRLCKIRESVVEEKSVGKSDNEAFLLESMW